MTTTRQDERRQERQVKTKDKDKTRQDGKTRQDKTPQNTRQGSTKHKARQHNST